MQEGVRIPGAPGDIHHMGLHRNTERRRMSPTTCIASRARGSRGVVGGQVSTAFAIAVRPSLVAVLPAHYFSSPARLRLRFATSSRPRSTRKSASAREATLETPEGKSARLISPDGTSIPLSRHGDDRGHATPDRRRERARERVDAVHPRAKARLEDDETQCVVSGQESTDLRGPQASSLRRNRQPRPARLRRVCVEAPVAEQTGPFDRKSTETARLPTTLGGCGVRPATKTPWCCALLANAQWLTAARSQGLRRQGVVTVSVWVPKPREPSRGPCRLPLRSTT